MDNEKKYRDRIRKLSLNIAYYRKYCGLTQEQLADKTELSREFISRIESPETDSTISLKTLFLLADVFSIKPYQLLIFKDD